MSKYIDLELPDLIDQLIRYTEDYTRMITYKVYSEEEFTQCKQKLAELHQAIKEKSSDVGTPVRNISPNFPETLDRPNGSPGPLKK